MILAATMAMTMAMPAFAANETIDPTQTGSITLYKYEKQTNDATPANGTMGSAPSDHTPLAGIEFKLYKSPNPWETDFNNLPTDPATATVPTGFVEQGTTQTTGADGSVQFADLPVGLYYLQEQGHSAVSDPVYAYITVPITDPVNKGSWLYHVTIYPKNTVSQDAPTIEEFVSVGEGTLGKSATTEYREAATWEISATIPEYVAAPTAKYEISDSIDTRLAYVANSASVKIGTDYATATAIPPANYTLTAPTAESNTLTVAFNQTGRTALAAARTTEGTKVWVSFDTTIVENVANLGVNIENDATVTYNKGLGLADGTATVAEKPEVHTGAIRINKHNPAGEALAGAKFMIYATEADAKAGDTTKAFKDAAGNAIEVITNANGKAVFEGLRYGTYYLVETQAPADYNLLTAPVAVTVGADSYTNDVGHWVSVLNKKGFVLPITGGMGTTLFTLAGILLLGGAAFLLLKKDKKSEAK